MISSRIMNIIRAPVISEKAGITNEQRCLILKVLPNATKLEIKQAVEQVLGLKVESVNTLNVLGKKRRTVKGVGVRSNWKKAYVTLQEGQNINSAFEDLQAADKESK